jgi:hypothetical protein
MNRDTIYVRLLREAVAVWRPVSAKHVEGSVYRILEQPHDPDTETWEFSPGAYVVCRLEHLDEGEVLAAVARSNCPK